MFDCVFRMQPLFEQCLPLGFRSEQKSNMAETSTCDPRIREGGFSVIAQTDLQIHSVATLLPLRLPIDVSTRPKRHTFINADKAAMLLRLMCCLVSLRFRRSGRPSQDWLCIAMVSLTFASFFLEASQGCSTTAMPEPMPGSNARCVFSRLAHELQVDTVSASPLHSRFLHSWRALRCSCVLACRWRRRHHRQLDRTLLDAARVRSLVLGIGQRTGH